VKPFDLVAMMWWKKREEEIKKKNNLKEFEVDEEGLPSITYKHSQRLKEKAMLVNYPVGSDVICKSNEDEPYKRGKLVNYMALSLACNLTPVVKYEGDSEPYVVLGIVRHYSKELCEALDKLDNIDQWNVLAEFHKITKELP